MDFFYDVALLVVLQCRSRSVVAVLFVVQCMVSWCRGVVVSRCRGVVASWRRGVVVSARLHGLIVLPREGLGYKTNKDLHATAKEGEGPGERCSPSGCCDHGESAAVFKSLAGVAVVAPSWCCSLDRVDRVDRGVVAS